MAKKKQKERVEITIEPQPGSSEPEVELPAVINVVDSFDGKDEHEGYANGEPMSGDIPELMKLIGPEIEIQGVRLKFESMDDFTPEGIVKQIPELSKMLDRLEALEKFDHQLDEREDNLIEAVKKSIGKGGK